MTDIQWTDVTWNPVRGCSRVSAGCDNCYAMGQAHRFSGEGQPYHGLTTIRRDRVDWTGFARLHPEMLAQPLKWRKPRRVFVNSMSDLFHESLSNEDIAAVFGVMAACSQHIFQVLTKRSKRMREWFEWVETGAVDKVACYADDALTVAGESRADRAWWLKKPSLPDPWPLPNVHLGVSAEDQAALDKRVPDLLATPAAVRWVSAEPLLGPLSTLSRWTTNMPRFEEATVRALGEISHNERDAAIERLRRERGNVPEDARLDWIVVGGESGSHARPCDVKWIEDIVGLCRVTGTPVFVKQLGSHVFADWKLRWDERFNGSFGLFSSDRVGVKGTNFATVFPNGVWHTWDAAGIGGENAEEQSVDAAKAAAVAALVRQHADPVKGWQQHAHMLRDRKGGDPSEWPEHLRVRQWPGDIK